MTSNALASALMEDPRVLTLLVQCTKEGCQTEPFTEDNVRVNATLLLFISFGLHVDFFFFELGVTHPSWLLESNHG